MQFVLPLLAIYFISSSCQSTAGREPAATVLVAAALDTVSTTITSVTPLEPAKDTVPSAILKPYTRLIYHKTDQLKAAPGTKSVLFNGRGDKLYAMNLEGMSIYEFDRTSRLVSREFKFKPTRGTGWDYETDKPIPSFEEKPVEACLSHDDKILWVSLHNAEGIVPIRLDGSPQNQSGTEEQPVKKVYVTAPGTTKDSFTVPLIRTGKTPKIISRTADSRHILVSNWHSYNVSVLELNESAFPYGKVIQTVPVSSIPRGIVVDDKNNRSFVAIMGGASLSVINNSVWMKEKDIQVASNPRHIVMDSSGRLFVSYNKLAKIACVDPETGENLFSATTPAQPRTIMLSKNHRFLFVTCYSSDKVEVFKINDNSFTRIASLPCKGHPVGVDIYEDDTKLEAWVCSYNNGMISVMSFRKE